MSFDLGSFGMLAFMNPWVLAGLVFLPVLWFLLRITPPAPRRIIFPATRFLSGLRAEEQTPSKTPWWILLVRIMAAASLILALAHPILNPAEALPDKGPVRIVIDNGWESAQTWNLQMEEAQTILDRAGRERREIFILTTAPEPGSNKPQQHGPLTETQARGIINGITPQPWPADPEKATMAAKEQHHPKPIHSFWLSTGIKAGELKDFVRTLQSQGALTFYAPEAAKLPILLTPSTKPEPGMTISLITTKNIESNLPVTVIATGKNGQVLDVQSTILTPDKSSRHLTFDIPEALSNQITRVTIQGRKGAGATLILDDQHKRRLAGIVTPKSEAESAPLIEAGYYLGRAMETFADVKTGTVTELIASSSSPLSPSMIILPDIGAMPPRNLNKLEEWVRGGGLLLRFAGPNMAQGTSFLTPVPLLKGDRALDGDLTWAEPVKLAPFPKTSPFYGLPISDDITVRRQILAKPVQDLDKKTWATLEDGTPLITASRLDHGLLVMIHTSATPSWSDLALSGLYVQILQRIINLSPGTAMEATGKNSGMLHPFIVLDGFGNSKQPGDFAQPIEASAFDNIIPGAIHPPGLYGRAGYQKALNIGERIQAIEDVGSMPLGVAHASYKTAYESDMLPFFMMIALGLFLFDWLIMIAMHFSNYIRPPRLAQTAVIIFACSILLFNVSPAAAETSETDMIRHANDMYLAYILGPSPEVNRTAHKGLEALLKVTTLRTSVEPAGVVALNPERDEMAFFPLIYWPITGSETALSDKAAKNIQSFLDHGGTILFDTRDQNMRPRSENSFASTRQAQALQRITSFLNIPPLEPMPKDHVLTRSFYLLRTLPGRYDNGTIWVEKKNSSNDKDGVSSVIIGSHDWAGAWEASAANVYPGRGQRQQEMAFRFGVNLIMYALTGNYKADQVHLPHILERLGQ